MMSLSRPQFGCPQSGLRNRVSDGILGDPQVSRNSPDFGLLSSFWCAWDKSMKSLAFH
jgi:hypothetical protein